MSWTPIAHTGQYNGGSNNGFTTSGINTTGANLVVVNAVQNAFPGVTSISDSNGNTWSALNQYTDAFSGKSSQLFYCYNPTVGTGHTFTIGGTGNGPALFVQAFSGSGLSPLDKQNGAGGYGYTAGAMQPGSITPTVNGELIIIGLLTDDATTISINNSFTITDTLPGSTNFGEPGGAMAYLVQTTAAAINPSWAWSDAANNRWASGIASFKPASGGGSVSGTLASTEAPDAASISGGYSVTGLFASTEGADTAAFSGTSVAPVGTLAVTETPDAASIAGSVSINGILATTEGTDTASIAGSFANNCTLATTETPDTAALSGSVFIAGTLTTTDTADSASISGSVFVAGSLTATETTDAASFSGNTVSSGTLAVTEAQDVAAFTSSSTVTGTLAATEIPDTASLSGTFAINGSLSTTESSDGASFAGSFFVGGSLSTTDTADAASFSGNIGISGQLVTSENSDSAAFAGQFIISGTFAVSERPDLLVFTSLSNVTGTLSATENGDVAAFILTAFPPNYNPLERLKMYTGTLGAVSNREDWIVNISFIDDDENALDISSAQNIGAYICPLGCPNTPVLSATLTSGIILPDNFTMQWMFSESDMQNLHPSQYDVFCRIEMSNITTQILSASVAIVEGGPRQ